MLSDSYVSLPLSQITVSLTDYWYITPTKCGKVKSKIRVTSYKLRFTRSNPRVTGSNPQVTSSDLRVTS